MNKLVEIRKKIKKAGRLHQSQILATKNGEMVPYRRSVFEERVKQAQRNNMLKDS